ncbi:MAG: hypothetical protein AAF944_23830 [Bacteroidota bacterium]
MKVILPLTLVLLLFATVSFSQTTYYVDLPPTGNDSNVGSLNSPWATVQHAISNVASGDIIIINSGRYSGTVNVNKTLTLVGAGDGDNQLTELSGTIAISSSDVTLETLTLSNTGSSLVVGGSNATVQNCIIDGTVRINSGGSGLTLTQNDFTTTGTAVNNTTNNAVDATYNWWSSNAVGDITTSITETIASVDYSPWLNLDTDTDISTNGFQPDLSSVSIDGDSPGGDDLQAAFDALSPGDTLRLVETGIGNPYNSLIVNGFIGQKRITISTPSGDQPTVNDIDIINDTIKISGNLRIAQSLDLFAGGFMRTLGNSQVTLGSAVTTVDENGGRMRGNFTIEPRNVGTADIDILGVNIQSGTDDIGNVTISRINDTNGIVNSNGSESFAITWEIDVETDPANGRTVEFSWWPESDNNRTGDVQIWRLDDVSGEWIVMTDAVTVTTSPTNVRTVTVGTIRNFSPWTVSDVSQPLPVVLTDFTARLERPSVRLEWATASETNSEFFSIERSTDGLSFEEVGRNQAAGESSDIRNYRYVDEGVANRLTGTLYYRLRMVDFDESYEYSNTVAVPLSTNNDLRLRADAKQGTVQMFTEHLPVGQYWIQVSDMAGNILAESPMKTTEDISTFSLPLNTPASGVYLLRCIGTRNLYIQKFRIE